MHYRIISLHKDSNKKFFKYWSLRNSKFLLSLKITSVEHLILLGNEANMLLLFAKFLAATDKYVTHFLLLLTNLDGPLLWKEMRWRICD